MYIEVILKIVMVFINILVKDEIERAKIKRQLMISTSNYHERVLDSVILRREWDELTRAYFKPE